MPHLSPDHMYEVVEETFVTVVRRPPTIDVLNASEARIQGIARSQRSKVGYLHIVLDVPTTGRIDDDIRAAFVATARRSLPNIDGSALVLLGEGFRAAGMRFAVTGALMALRPVSPVRIFASVREGAVWLSTLRPQRDPEKLVQTADELSAALLSDLA